METMSARDLTQVEADHLLAMEKGRSDRKVHTYPDLGGKLTVPLRSTDGLEAFLLDLSRGRISLRREKLQTRARRTVVLARLDIGGRPHRNPDDSLIGSPHLHLYREGFGARWAFPVPETEFRNLSDPNGTLSDFLLYCNVVRPPFFQRGLFA